MAFTTVTGSNGVTTLVGTTGVDIATIVSLGSAVYIGANTGDDNVAIALATGNNVAEDYQGFMGGGDDTLTSTSVLLNSSLSLDGETIANDGDDTFNSTVGIINSEIVGRGGVDVLGVANNLILSGSIVNGNTGDDEINVGVSSASFVYGGQDSDTINLNGNMSGMLINGNKGSDFITANNAGTGGAGAVAGSFSGSVYGGNGNDVINLNAVAVTAATSTGAYISGDLADDNIVGTNGIDTIFGGSGSDVITGAVGGDIINVDTSDTLIYAAGDATVAVGANTGFDTINGYVANTLAAGTNGVVISIGVTVVPPAPAVAPNYVGNTIGVAAGADLNATLDATFVGAASGDVMGINIIGGSFAGNYIAIDNDGVAGFTAASDTVIKVSSIASLNANAFTA